jgi:hypothetical protein
MSVKVNINKDDWWPVYTLDMEPASNSVCYTVDDELIMEYKNIMKKFNEMQDTIQRIKKKGFIE